MYRKEYERWCKDSYFDEMTKRELIQIVDDEKEIKDRFYRRLAFGTGGMRGILGAGTNRMNIYTVRLVTQGLANYITLQNGAEKGVAIAYDSRIMSSKFAEEAALCLNANGIRTYRFESLRPTPELSFAVRELGCIAGIVITASHNPSQYNGYKVYWEDGAQITSPHDKNILNEMEKVTSFTQVKCITKDIALKKGLYKEIGEEIDTKYIEAIKEQLIHKDIIKEIAGTMKIVYTPLHGAGNVLVRRILKEIGFENIYVVKEQELPDGNFPTVLYPNPESAEAFKLAIELAKKIDADIILATDPDADRLGVYCKDTLSGEYIAFTGNMSGVLIAEYIFREKSEMKVMPENPIVIKTIVTTEMVKAVAKKYGIELREVLTGFKYIGEQIKRITENDNQNFIFGLEESYGCLSGTYARDKDACVAVMLLCEVAAWYKKKKMTLWDAMLQIYEQYGYYREALETITLPGIDGTKQIGKIMSSLREDAPTSLGGFKVLAIRDYLEGKKVYLEDGKVEVIDLPISDVLYYELERNAWCCIRPSGTEPKIKFYFGVKGNSLGEAEELLDNMKGYINKLACIEEN